MFIAFYLLYDEKKHLTKWKMLFVVYSRLGID